MAVEARRGCGFRKVGGIYLVGDGPTTHCDRMPFELTACDVCGSEIKFSRGFQWMNALKFLGRHEGCADEFRCPICDPDDEKYGLMWVGEKFYTTHSFIEEAIDLGVSKRISNIPKELVLGKTRILLAHNKAKMPDERTAKAIFYSFIPRAIEKIITKSQSKDPSVMGELKDLGYTPVIVPDDDLDHQDIEDDDISQIRRLIEWQESNPTQGEG